MQRTHSTPIALVVSQDPYKSSFFKRVLKGLFHVVSATDSFMGIDVLKSMQISLIIIDERTLTKTWMILAEQVRKLHGYREVPMLLITNNLKKNFLVHAINKGISDFINEPLDADEICQRILVATQSNPVTKKISLMTKKFKRAFAGQPLKQVLSRRFVVTEDAIREIASVQKKHSSLCLLLIEVDDFQKISQDIDQEGMATLLSYLKSIFQTYSRSFDMLLPQGGGRFLMMLPKTSHTAGLAFAETLKNEAHRQPFHYKRKSIPLSLSIGVVHLEKGTSFENPYDQFGDLLKKVDEALSKAKQTRNKIISN